MATGIEKFLSKNARKDRVERFEELSKGKTKEEIREIEVALLRPDAIPDYVGELSRYALNQDTTVKLVFKTKEDMSLVGKYMNITAYIEPSISDIKIILDLFNALEEGRMKYNKKTGEFTFVETVIEEVAPPTRKLFRREK